MVIHKVITVSLIASMVWMSLAPQSMATGIPDQLDNISLQQKVHLFGVGADVKAKLSGGQTVRGEISAISDNGFELLSEQHGTGRWIDYDQVMQLDLASLRHAGSEISGAVEARRVIAALGVGKHIMVRTDRMKIHGRILAISEADFMVLPDDSTQPVRIAYQDLQKAGKNLGILSTIGLVVVVIAVVAIIKWTR